MVRAALGLDQAWRLSEEVVHELVTTLAPKLRHIPIEGKPWRFTAERRYYPWQRRPGFLTAPKTGGGWSWRTSPGEALSGVLREHVLGHLDLGRPCRSCFQQPRLVQLCCSHHHRPSGCCLHWCCQRPRCQRWCWSCWCWCHRCFPLVNWRFLGAMTKTVNQLVKDL